MKKVSNWSLVGYAVGIFVIIFTAARYLFLYPDFSQMILFIFSGAAICAFSWVYNRILGINNTLNAVEEYLADNLRKVKV
ncbi:MAG: hypothetical protein ABIH72_04075 [archaeon]